MKTNAARSRRFALRAEAALFAAAIAVLSQVMIPLPMVPVNLALLGVFLAGALLGPLGGALSVLYYLALGAVGLPVFAGFQGGLGVMLGKTGGFLAGYLPCVTLAGWLYLKQRGGIAVRFLVFAGALLPLYAMGTLWFMRVTGRGVAESLGFCVFPFLPADAAKAALSALLAPRLRKAMPRHVPLQHVADAGSVRNTKGE